MLPEAERRWHEGSDFVDQAEVARLARGEKTEARVRVPTWVLLTLAILRELRLRKKGVAASEEVAAWKVELWEAFWNGESGSQEPPCQR